MFVKRYVTHFDLKIQENRKDKMKIVLLSHYKCNTSPFFCLETNFRFKMY